MDNRLDMLIKLKTTTLFNPMHSDMQKLNVMAAVFYAASHMAMATDYENARDVCLQELLDLYHQTENESLKEMIPQMGSYVKSLTGLSYDVTDFGVIMRVLETNKSYEAYFEDIFQRAQKRKLENPQR